MSSFPDRPEQFLEGLESLLQQGPRGSFNILVDMTSWLKQVDLSQSFEAVEKAVSLLATSVGAQHDWQTPYRESGLLEQVLDNLDPVKTPSSLGNQYLRVIGNSVADNDSNRRIASSSYEKLVACLDNPELTKTALAVLYNHGTDFEFAHTQGALLRVDSTIAEKLSGDKIPEAAISFATDILTWCTGQLTPEQLLDDTSLQVFENLLLVSTDYDEDHIHEYLAILVHYLQDPSFQQKVATLATVERLVGVMLEFESTELTEQEAELTMQELDVQINSESASSETNVILMTRLVNSICALAASDGVVLSCTLDSPVVLKLRETLKAAQALPSTVCACIMLGNLATSDQMCIAMVTTAHLHVALKQILTTRKEQALLYAATGFMRHLAFPISNRPILGEAGLVEICCQLLTGPQSTVRGEAAATLMKLASDCFPNIKKIITEAVPIGTMPAELASADPCSESTILSHLVAQGLAPVAPLPSTTMKNPMIEIGRTLVAILRYVRRPGVGHEVDILASELLKCPSVARPMARLVRQRFYADVRWEGLLGLGLMVGSPIGAIGVINELKADEGLLDAIKELAEEKQSGGQNLTRDFQNAASLLQGLIINGGDSVDGTMSLKLKTLQAEFDKLRV